MIAIASKLAVFSYSFVRVTRDQPVIYESVDRLGVDRNIANNVFWGQDRQRKGSTDAVTLC